MVTWILNVLPMVAVVIFASLYALAFLAVATWVIARVWRWASSH